MRLRSQISFGKGDDIGTGIIGGVLIAHALEINRGGDV